MPATAVSTPEVDAHTGNSVSALPFFKMCVRLNLYVFLKRDASQVEADADISMVAIGQKKHVEC